MKAKIKTKTKTKTNCKGCIYWKEMSRNMACHFCLETGHLRKRDEDICFEKTTKRSDKVRKKSFVVGHLKGESSEIDEYIKNKNGTKVPYVRREYKNV